MVGVGLGRGLIGERDVRFVGVCVVRFGFGFGFEFEFEFDVNFECSDRGGGGDGEDCTTVCVLSETLVPVCVCVWLTIPLHHLPSSPSRGSLYQKLLKIIDKRGYTVDSDQQESSLVALRVLLVDRGLPFEDDDDEGKLLSSFLADLREARDKKKNLARLSSPVTTVFHGPFTNVTLRTAVGEWCQNRHAAEIRYGKITSWDVSAVTDMSRLFSNSCYAGSSRPTTQSPKISTWDVSNVTSMREVRNCEEQIDEPGTRKFCLRLRRRTTRRTTVMQF